ncbi:MAG: HlyD family efflux transporter periplasmic adaptor subunit [Dysgonamonadaceae bacterium]
MNEISENPSLNQEEHLKSEEVQAIIERMPTDWTRWIAICVGALIATVLLLGFVIKYPDTVDGRISVTAVTAPVRLVANANGRIILLQPNNSFIEENTVISYIENGADYKHILWVDSLLVSRLASENLVSRLPDSLLLGEASSAYNAFMLAYLQYERLAGSLIYTTMLQNLQGKIRSDRLVVENLNDELKLKTHILMDSREQLQKDSLLFAKKVISEYDYLKQRATHLALKEACLSLQSSVFMKLSEISQSELEMQRIRSEESENKEKAYSELITQKNALANAIRQWKEHYLQYSPAAGELEYLGFWRDNSFIRTGQELFSVIPDRNNILGEVLIPSYGAGKVEVGQTVNVKIDNYPYDEYGLLKGIVKSVSRITNKVETANGTSDSYLAVISFPEGTVTNFGKLLPLDFETKGTAEIITRRKRLIERLFDNLKAKTEK